MFALFNLSIISRRTHKLTVYTGRGLAVVVVFTASSTGVTRITNTREVV